MTLKFTLAFEDGSTLDCIAPTVHECYWQAQHQVDSKGESAGFVIQMEDGSWCCPAVFIPGKPPQLTD